MRNGFLLAAVLLGACLRLIWPEDMEYKLDEAWTFARTQQAGQTEPFPWLGMPSSKNVLNPGMSVWIFLALGKLFRVDDPVELVRAVQITNVVALFLLAGFVLRCVPAHEREPWVWGIALAAVNPLGVLFQRKIWPPSLFALPAVLMLIAWWHRDRRGPAFAWGVFGACLGQIHLSGFFLAAGFVLSAVLFDHRRVAWGAWLVGSCLGALPMAPWLYYLATTGDSLPGNTLAWHRPFGLKFFTTWVTEPLGIGLHYALREDFADFLTYPLWHGRRSYLVLGLHAVLLATGILIAVVAIWRRWHAGADATPSPTGQAVNAAFWGYGLLLTLSCLPFYRHYLLVAFPYTYLWLARLALGPAWGTARWVGRVSLAVLFTGQLALTVQFLGYIHAHAGSSRGDYGQAYRSPQNYVRVLEERGRITFPPGGGVEILPGDPASGNGRTGGGP